MSISRLQDLAKIYCSEENNVGGNSEDIIESTFWREQYTEDDDGRTSSEDIARTSRKDDCE